MRRFNMFWENSERKERGDFLEDGGRGGFFRRRAGRLKKRGSFLSKFIVSLRLHLTLTVIIITFFNDDDNNKNVK